MFNQLIQTAYAQTDNDYFFGRHMMDGGYFGFGGYISMIIFWGIIVLAIVLIYQAISRSRPSERQEKSALDILAERYAKGEIDKKEYEEKRKDLNG